MVREILKRSINKIRDLFSSIEPNKSPYIFTAAISLIVSIIGINAFVELSADVKAELMGDFDQIITNYLIDMRSSGLTRFFTFVTDIGDVQGYLVVLIICSALFYLVFKKWTYVLQISAVLILATISNIVLKRVFDRARPELEHLVSVKSLSYPSGHAMSSMAFYGFLIYLIYKFPMTRLQKLGIIAILAFLIFSIGTSRIYLGVHFPSDVLGGWIAGAIWVFFCILLFNLVEIFKRDPKT